MAYRPNGRLRYRAREFRRALRAHLRAGGDLTKVAKKTGIEKEDLQLLLGGKIHWVGNACADSLSDLMRVPEVVVYPELGTGTIPLSVIKPHLDSLIDEFGITLAATVCGIPARRLQDFRNGAQLAVEPETADKIVLAAEGAAAWRDDPVLRRWWWTCLPGDVLRPRSAKMQSLVVERKRSARQQVEVLG